MYMSYIIILPIVLCQDIVIRIPLRNNPKDPSNHYIHTNHGLRPLSLQNVMGYTEIPPHFNFKENKKIFFEKEKRGRDMYYSGSFDGLQGRRRFL